MPLPTITPEQLTELNDRTYNGCQMAKRLGIDHETVYHWRHRIDREGFRPCLLRVMANTEMQRRIQGAQEDINNPEIPSPTVDAKHGLRPGYTNERRWKDGIKVVRKTGLVPRHDNPSFEWDFEDNGYFSIEKWAQRQY